MFIMLHEIKGAKVNKVLLNTDWLKHAKPADNTSDTYIKLVKGENDCPSFFFVRETVEEIYGMIYGMISNSKTDYEKFKKL